MLDETPLPVTLALPDRIEESADLDASTEQMIMGAAVRRDVRTRRRLVGLLRIERDGLVLEHRPVTVVERRAWSMNSWDGSLVPRVLDTRTETGPRAELRLPWSDVAAVALERRGVFRPRLTLCVTLRHLAPLDVLDQLAEPVLRFALATADRRHARALLSTAELRLAESQLARLAEPVRAPATPLPAPETRAAARSSVRSLAD